MDGFAVRSYGSVRDRKLTFKDGLQALGNRDKKKLENNTYLVRVDDKTLGVKLHNTIVVYIHQSGNYSLDTGGWRSVTTKERINSYSPARLHQTNNIWYIGDHGIFADGVTVNKQGKPTSKLRNPGEVERKKRRLDKLVLSYIRAFAKHVVFNGLYTGEENATPEKAPFDVVELAEKSTPLQPGPGDCWACSLKGDKPDPLGVDHLLSHMGLGEDAEVYFVPSLLWNALADHSGNPPLVWHMIAQDAKRGDTRLLERYLTQYFRKRKPALLELEGY